MKKICTYPTWLIFAFVVLPGIFFPDNSIGSWLTIIWLVIIAFCIYSLGNALNTRLPMDSNLRVKKFNIFLLFMVVYLVTISILYPSGYSINQDNYQKFGVALYFIVPLHFFFMFCIFYTVWFIAKSIAEVENDKKVGFDGYFKYFFLLIFFPIGIWWMYPKIRRIFSTEKVDTFLA